MEGFIGQLIMFTGSYAPTGWALCQGDRMSINDNQALYSIIGTKYGGDGTSYFCLPNLQTVKNENNEDIAIYLICVEGIYPAHN